MTAADAADASDSPPAADVPAAAAVGEPVPDASKADAATEVAELDPAVRWRSRLIVTGVAVALALPVQLLATASPDFAEHVYARRIYPVVATVLNLITGWLPFSLAELILVGLTGVTAFRVGRASVALVRRRRRPRRVLGWGVATALPAVAIAWAALVLLWGVNYRRPPLAESLDLDASSPTVQELEAAAVELVELANRLREDPRIVEDAAGAIRFPEGAREALARAPRGYEPLAEELPELIGPAYGPPKPVLGSAVMSYLSTTGIFIPYTGEANVNVTAPPSRLPFIASHELAHQQGFAAEDEASYVAWRACRRHPDADYAYSGAFMAALHVESALAKADPAAFARVRARWSAACLRDLAAYASWFDAYDTPVGDLSDAVNDTYLKLQGKEGVASYGRLVLLLVAERRTRERSAR